MTLRLALTLSLVACSASTPPPAPAPMEAPPAEEAPAPAPVEAAKPLVRGDDSTRKSKNGEVTATIGEAKVTITYGRPSMNRREIFGKLVPYGAVWRTGADEATVLTTTADLKLGDSPIKAGTYGLFTIPGATEWTVILNSQPDQWGSYDYDASKDVARATVAATVAPSTEVFTIEATEGGLVLMWADVAVPLPLAAP